MIVKLKSPQIQVVSQLLSHAGLMQRALFNLLHILVHSPYGQYIQN